MGHPSYDVQPGDDAACRDRAVMRSARDDVRARERDLQAAEDELRAAIRDNPGGSWREDDARAALSRAREALAAARRTLALWEG